LAISAPHCSSTTFAAQIANSRGLDRNNQQHPSSLHSERIYKRLVWHFSTSEIFLRRLDKKRNNIKLSGEANYQEGKKEDGFGVIYLTLSSILSALHLYRLCFSWSLKSNPCFSLSTSSQLLCPGLASSSATCPVIFSRWFNGAIIIHIPAL